MSLDLIFPYVRALSLSSNHQPPTQQTHFKIPELSTKSVLLYDLLLNTGTTTAVLFYHIIVRRVPDFFSGIIIYPVFDVMSLPKPQSGTLGRWCLLSRFQKNSLPGRWTKSRPTQVACSDFSLLPDEILTGDGSWFSTILHSTAPWFGSSATVNGCSRLWKVCVYTPYGIEPHPWYISVIVYFFLLWLTPN